MEYYLRVNCPFKCENVPMWCVCKCIMFGRWFVCQEKQLLLETPGPEKIGSPDAQDMWILSSG